jgi:membrane associated rhomboid family serine protease
MMLSSGSSWRTPLAKLVGLVVVLPFGATYLHLHRRSFLVNEYCFVGPAAPDDDGAVPRDYILRNAIAGAVADDNGRDVVFVDNGVRVDGSGGGRSAGRHGGVADGGYPYHGIYAPASSTGSGQGRGADDDGRRDFPQRYSPIDDDVDDGSPRWWPWTRPGTIGRAGGWQSVARSSAVAFLPPSSSSRGARSDRVIAFVDADGGGGGGGGAGGMWCLKSSLSSAAIPEDEDEGEDVRSWCADVEGGGGVPSSRYPPSGMWKSSDPRGGTARPPPPPPSLLRITCPPPTPAAAISAPSGGGGRRGVRNPERNENLGFVLDKPGTTLLLLLNVGLAFHYWNRRIDPSSVCKRYDRIAIDGEWWRGLSGATAHFEPLHLGFNMMSLRALGDELEGAGGKWYGDAFAFLAYNVALVVFTTIVMMALVRARLSWTRRELDALPPPSPPRASCEERMARLRGTSSVGYSAVLFAWMVISTMERAGPTCPVPFFSDLCFETRAVPGMPYLRYNAAPVVSLFAAQFVMPRASFMG